MIQILLCGCNGRMGRTVAEILSSRDDMRIAAGIDVAPVKYGAFPVYADFAEYSGPADVVIDFSHYSSLPALLSYCLAKKVPLVLATTGHTDSQKQDINEASVKIPVFFAANMSLGISLIAELAKKAAQILGAAYDVEIVEKHHRHKLDAPSGTALSLAQAITSVRPDLSTYTYDRQSERRERNDNEIGISSIRGGSIVGEHEIIFAGLDELIEIKHTANSRAILASGAVKAASFIYGKAPGLYGMQDILAGL
jgi:4-hydroxy-tetrahydrodipicolinate reductase